MKKLALLLTSAAALLLGSLSACASGPASQVKKTPDVAADKLLETILADYKGEVVLVDFWATWCGPCKRALQEIAPLKDGRLKGVKFVYVTSETSPKETWEKMIPDISGDHYYLTDDQLGAIYGQISSNAFPTYLVVDKKGFRSRTFIGYEREPILNLLDSALKQ